MIPGVPADARFVSYSRDREDVVLWRALGAIADGRYVEVAADHPEEVSATRAFRERGWSGVTIAPLDDDADADAHDAEHARDTTLRADGADRGTASMLRQLARVIEEHGGPEHPVHLVLVTTSGAEEQVLASIDLRAFRPWVLVIGSGQAPQTRTSWEPGVLAAGYEPCLFDGVSWFYVAHEHAARLGAALSYPACTRDDFLDAATVSVQDANDELIREVTRWRGLALTAWATWEPRTVSEWSIHDERERDSLRVELERIQQTLSWRITRPLRALRRVTRR